MAATKKDDKKVMDVSKPSETKAEATSKPVIVGHKTQVQDPMVSNEPEQAEEEKATETPQPEKRAKTGGERRIEPLVVEEVAAAVEEKSEKDETPVEESETEADEKPVENQTEEKSEDSKESDGAPVDSVLSGANSVKEAEIAAVQKQEALEKMMSSGDYRVPIGQPRKHHRKGSFVKGFLAVLATLTVLAAGAYLLVDANIIKTDIKLPYEFFKDSQPVEDTGGPVKKVTPTPVAAPKKTTITTTKEPIFSITLEEGWKNVDLVKMSLTDRYLFAAEVGPVKDLGLDIITDESKPLVPLEKRSSAYLALGVWTIEPSTNAEKPTALDLPQDNSLFTTPLQNCTELGTVTINGTKRIMTMHNGTKEPATELSAIKVASEPIVQYIEFFKSGCKVKAGVLDSFQIDEHLFDFKGKKHYIRVDMNAKALGMDETGLAQAVDGRKLKALPEIQNLKAMLESIKLK